MKSRNKVLIEERSELKKKMKFLHENYQQKSQCDDMYIKTLKNLTEKLKSENQTLQKNSLQDESVIQNFNQLNSKNEEILSL